MFLLSALIISISVFLQLVTAVLALKLISISRHQLAWIWLTLALALMTVRRLMAFAYPGTLDENILPVIYDFVGLLISAAMLFSVSYLRRYIEAANSAEQSLRESEQNYRILAQNIPNSKIILFDQNGVCTLVAGSALNDYGMTNDRMEGKPIGDFFPSGFRQQHEEFFRAAKNRETINTSLEYAGRVYSVNIVGLSENKAGRTGGVILVTDLTEHKKRELELEAIHTFSDALRKASTQAEMLPIILDQVITQVKVRGAAIYISCPECEEACLKLAHGGWDRWTGKALPQEQLAEIANRQEMIIHNLEDESVCAAYSDTEFGAGLKTIIYLPLKIQDQPPFAWLIVGSDNHLVIEDIPLLIAIGNITSNALNRTRLHEDLLAKLDALEKAQARLVQSEKLAAVGELVAGVAHELNNPLTAIILHSQLLQQRIADKELEHSLIMIVRESMRAGRIVRGLLNFARQRPPERKPVQVNEILEECLEMLSYELRTNNIHLDTSLSPDLPNIMADPQQLQQVFINLINNAWQMMSSAHGGGNLFVSSEIGRSTFLAGQENPPMMIQILFQDDGPGIPQDLLLRIFDPFFTTKPEGHGTGLGLSICHGIVNEHAGHIWAESRPGGFTTFTIELPLSAEMQPEPLMMDELAPANGTGLPAHILIVDDEQPVAEVLGRALTRKGYIVEMADNGKTAQAVLDRRDFDLILCDVRMPELDGMAFYKHIQEKHPFMAQRIIFTTGDVLNPATRRFIETTGVNYLSKPFGLGQLIAKVKQILEKQANLGLGQVVGGDKPIAHGE